MAVAVGVAGRYFRYLVLVFMVVVTQEQDASQSLRNQQPSGHKQHSMFESGKHPETMSITIGDRTHSHDRNYIKIVRPPESIHHLTQILVDYVCDGQNQRVGLQIKVSLDGRTEKAAFTYIWKCQKKVGNATERRKVIVRLPRKLAYKSSHQNPHSLHVKYAVVQAWVLDAGLYQETKNKTKNYYSASQVKVLYYARVWAPNLRYEAPIRHCYAWLKQLEFSRPFKPLCVPQPEVIKVLSYPAVLSGTYHGIHHLIANYTKIELKTERISKFQNPSFTVLTWVYIVDYCPAGTPLCSILQRLTWNDKYMTPLIYVNQRGQLHLQIVTEVGEPIAHLTSFRLPREQWLRIVCSFNNSAWEVNIHYGNEWKKVYHTSIKVESDWPVWYDDQAGLHVVGGSELNPGIKGYIGEVVIYRRRAQDIKTIPFPPPNHPMFQLGMGDKTIRCERYLSWIRDRIIFYKSRLAKLTTDHGSCPAGFLDRVPNFKQRRVEPLCDIYGGPRSKNYRFARKWVWKQIMSGQNFKLIDVGTAVFNHASEILETQGFPAINEVVPLLKQSSCYGNHDASYMLSVILTHGVSIKVDETMAHAYLMRGAVHNHRLSVLALGNKHVYGLDGIPHDLDQAYMYYKNVADKTRKDREDHAEDDVYTEAVRLTDEESLEEQTDEEGDLFLWFKHQASLGVVHAQRNMARLLFWGSQGVKRNLEAAAEFYRISAEGGEPSALFDYGIVLLKGQGTPQNYTGAMHYLSKAAEKGHAGAYNALGWYALEIKDNRTHALELFNKSRQLGNADAIHNIGHMYIGGRFPGMPYIDRINAFKYFSEAALKGQIDSSNMVALYNIRGHPNVTRNADMAVAWARYVAELSPKLGKVLAKGLKAFRHNSWPAALLYYMQAADAGIEVGNFNLAMICEENKEGVTSYVEKECIWRYYNLSTKREPKMVDPYSWIKMGDYYWYGCQGNRNPAKAAVMYANGALKGDPHAMFNLAFLVEEGVYVPPYILNSLGIPKEAQASNITILIDMYSKCQESWRPEAYIACNLALLRIEMIDIWMRYHLLVKMSSVLGSVAASVVTISSLYTYWRNQRGTVATV